MKSVLSDTSSSSVRAFIAVPVDLRVIQQIVHWQQSLWETVSSSFVRWVRPEQIHLTLRFFGDVPAEQLPGIESATRQSCVAFSELNLAAQGIGCFPNLRSPRVVWAGIIGDVAQLAQLQIAIAENTRAFGEPPDQRPFQPHLTIGRIKQPSAQGKEALAQSAGESAQRNFGGWRVNQVELMRSVLSPQGSTYSMLAAFPLIRQVGPLH